MKAKTMTIRKVLTPLLALCFLAAAPSLAAQDSADQGGNKGKQKQQYQQKSTQPEPEDFNKKELKQFANARGEVDEIRKEYSEELSQVEDQDEARQLQDKYSKQMVQSIKKEGLTVQKYNKISRAAQSNPELNQKINQMSN
ncbi:MAG: DUF4168 domain-containing protein [Desulfobacterales bacterium]|nr:DUF4168 domain-containing protein [Desulfobacterales bacterium]